MKNTISDIEALEFFKEKWLEIGQASNDEAVNLMILDRLENERAILFYVLDKRYWDDLRISRFSGWPISIGGRFVLHYFDKASQTFKDCDEPCPYFTNEEMDDFFCPEETDSDVGRKLQRFGVVRQLFLRQILEANPFAEDMFSVRSYDGPLAKPSRDPTKKLTASDGSKYFISLNKQRVPLSAEEEELHLRQLEKRLTELGITHWREGNKLAVEKLYMRSQ